MPVLIKSIAKYLPERIMTNNDLSALVETTDEWIKERTGISERRIAADGEMTSDMAAKAAELAIQQAGLEKKDIDCIILATCCPDQPSPSTACITQKKLGMSGIPAFDISAMCSGFLYGLQVASGLLISKAYKNILLIGSEKISSILDWSDRTTCILFGDGAGASVLSLGEPDEGHELISIFAGADGDFTHLLEVPQTTKEKCGTVTMQGKDLFKHAVRHLVDASEKVLVQAGVESEQIKWLVPHQANSRILETTAKRFKVPMDKVIINLHKYGNTSAASIPIALEEGAVKFNKGDLILCPAFGGGLTWAACLIRW